MAWRLIILPTLFGFGLKLLGTSKVVMHCSASIKKIESNDKPAKLSGDKPLKYIKLSTISLANCFPGNGARNACWHFLCPIEYIFYKHKESPL